MAKQKDNSVTPPRVMVGTTMNSAFIDGYWAQIDGMTQAMWMSMPPAKRYENTLNHLAAQATLAAKLAEGKSEM